MYAYITSSEQILSLGCDSSVGIVAKLRAETEATDFHRVQTSSGTHPDSHPMSTGG
jgi:hypothetical protein